MTRSILQACLPCFVALAVGCVLLWVVMRLSGGRWNWRRLRELHRCQDGGVQSLSFVLTLPLFIVIMLFIVQMSQLMIGIMVVHYAAFTATRSAVVWLPAHIPVEEEPENRMRIVTFREVDGRIFVVPEDDSRKYSQVRTAAVLGLAPICPSRNLGVNAGSVTRDSLLATQSAQRMYRAMAPSSASNGRINPRIANKIAYADLNTTVILSWRDARNGGGRETYNSPSFNPRNHPNPDVPWEPGEVGWQDAVTVHLVHRFALLPGPGRFLAKHIVPSSGIPDRVYQQIQTDRVNYREPVYSVNIHASATLPNEGFKSVQPYEQN